MESVPPPTSHPAEPTPFPCAAHLLRLYRRSLLRTEFFSGLYERTGTDPATITLRPSTRTSAQGTTMTLLSSAALTVALAAASPPRPAPDDAIADATALPATCISELGPDPVEPPPPWFRLLPTISVSYEIWPDRRGRFQRQEREPTVSSSARNRSWRDDRTRWRLALRWRSGANADTAAFTPAEPVGLSRHCKHLAELHTRGPADLREAVEHWADTARLEALIGADQQRGGRDD